MIVFLNFAPIEFMGGAEKWMLSTAKKINKKEKTHLISVDESISNIYAKLILKREFDRRLNKINHPYSKVTVKSLIPYTNEWRQIRNTLASARLIYSRFELQELLIIIYFSGFSGINKTITGLHSPLIYKTPLTLTDKLHNSLYTSRLSKAILKRVKRIHVLNKRDKEFLKNEFSLSNVSYVPNGVRRGHINANENQDSKRLNVLFVGELSLRKGVDILIDLAENIPKNIFLTIVGDGEYKREVKKIKKKNVVYKGYLDSKKMPDIYSRNDVLLLPSRAESMPLVLLEALSYGLKIVDSSNISLGMRSDIEHSVKNFNGEAYITALLEIGSVSKSNKEEISKYFERNFSEQVIDRRINSNIFSL